MNGLNVTSARGRHLRFRELVILWLRASGIDSVTARREFRKISDTLSEPQQPAGDLLGIDGWTVNVSTGVTRDLSGDLDRVQQAALREGQDGGAVVYTRPGRPVGDAYVLMTLDAFSSVLRDRAARG